MNLLAGAQRLLGTVLSAAQFRLILIGKEIEEEKLRLFASLLWAALALLLLGLGTLLLVAFLVVLCWDSHRLEVLGGLTVLCLGTGGGFLFFARTRLRLRPARPGGLFNNSVEELRRDCESLALLTTQRPPRVLRDLSQLLVVSRQLLQAWRKGRGKAGA